jgi:hypothetical protein
VTFQEHAAELARLEALAKSLGMSFATFERIALEVAQDAHRSSVVRTSEQTLAEIRRRIEPPRTKKSRAP